MSLQIPSGLITGVSGGNITSGTTRATVTYPLPVLLMGNSVAAASGNSTITHFSGALNVNISGGSITTSISGNVVLVVSGGVIQVSGAVTIATSGAPSANVVVAISGGTPLPVGAGEGDGANFNPALKAETGIWAFNGGSTFDRSRTTQGASGVATGILAAYLFWQYKMVSGATASGGFIINIASGTTALHSIVPITTTALGFVNVMDATSGNAGALVANFSGVVPLTTLLYDIILTSGLQVIVASGASFAATIAYRNPA